MTFLRDFLGMPDGNGSKRRTQGSVESDGGTSPLAGVVPPPRPAAASTAPTLENAMGLSPVFRAVSIIVTTGAQLDVNAWRGTDPVRNLIVENPSTDPHVSELRFKKQTLASMATTGNAFWRVYRGPAGEGLGLDCLNPLNMRLDRDSRGRRIYAYLDGETGLQHEFTRDQIEHLRLLEVPGLEVGMGPLQAWRAEVTGALDLRSFAAEWFRPKDVPTGVLRSDQMLSKVEADHYREEWHRIHAYGDEIAVLGKGLDYDPILLKPADAQFLETRQYTITDAARVFGLPATYLLAAVEGSSMTYQNMLEANTAYVRLTLMAYLNEYEDAMSRVIPRGQRARFDLTGFLRADDKTRAETNRIGVESGWLLADEVRQDEGRKPFTPAQREQAQAQAAKAKPAVPAQPATPEGVPTA